MANEAVIVELGFDKGKVERFTVADGTAISKGTLLKLTDPRTAAAATADNDVFAGIASADKVANDGSTTLGLYTRGLFDLRAETQGAITAGQHVTISAANIVKSYTSLDDEKGYVVGRAQEDVSAGASETILVRLGTH